MLYGQTDEVPDEAYTIPFGKANVTREGEDVTIVAFSRMVHIANDVADGLAKEGVSVEVIDPRTTSPLDADTILESVEATGRLVVVDEASARCGMAADIAGLVAQEAFGALKAPILQVTPPHTPVPFSPVLEAAFIPNADKVEAAVRKVLGAPVGVD